MNRSYPWPPGENRDRNGRPTAERGKIELLERQPERLFEQLPDPRQELGAVGAVEDAVVAGEGHAHQLARLDLARARDQMQLSLVCDHRILYGADGAQFLARVKELLEQPLSLAL